MTLCALSLVRAREERLPPGQRLLMCVQDGAAPARPGARKCAQNNGTCGSSLPLRT